MEKTKDISGITLVALVVTIVILIILATISVNIVMNGGLIDKAQRGKELYENAGNEENEMMDRVIEYTNKIIGSTLGGSESSGDTESTAGKPITKPGTWTSEKVVAIDDGNGSPVPLPEGYHYVGGDIDKGLVISDKEGDTLNASGVNMGNQFVWIPVKNATELGRSQFNDNGEAVTGLDTSYTEPYASGYSGESSEYNLMKTQVLKYGGFFIGRFEAGINSTELRTTYTTAQTVVSKKGVAPYNHVPWGKAINDAGQMDGKSSAVYLSKNMYSGSTSVTSTLCYGSQWDAMCRYIGDSQRVTPTKAGAELTGSTSTDISKNIYDLAGNCYEWTMETYSTRDRMVRGGFYNNSKSISNRESYRPINIYEFISFRVALYIK